MGTKYNSLEELRRKKELLKKDVSEMENLLTFENTKESLSAFTNGLTDQFLQEKTAEDGERKVSLNTGAIVKQISNAVTENILSRNAMYGIAKSDAGVNLVENALKLGAVTFVGNYAKKNFYNSNWKKKLIGIALIYLAPIALKYIRKKLENYQRNRTTSSLEQLI
ncbi:phosphoribosyl-ATP pyrophosphatase [Chryseobacterium suipulveris]|uniref:Phosphoribosyl-ATP pyrophosphatase n=1 Tax=Chryseobacterium suipulveris TaxID=2929800 RepID=A0ABY4BKW3_9FLAO|nr:phosphoribosyl-ATP pyrophosphatase [Chryseobacterium suipulveris]UOE39828.1 phosphoribosyl-ATP pyrophosphatase [Chryseobacterium suipulveris]